MTDPIQLAGPEYGPTAGGAPRQLVILLHGRGADGNDLIGLAPYFAEVLPNAAFVAPNAPYPCDGGPFGYQWFNIGVENPEYRLVEIRHSAEILNGFIDGALAARGLTDAQMALIGFSQGTMMSLFVAPRRETPCAGVMGYSGRLESPDLLADEVRSRPPVVLVHGDQDPLLPVSLIDDATRGLKAAGIAVESHVHAGLGHNIDEAGVQIGMRFLAGVLGGATG